MSSKSNKNLCEKCDALLDKESKFCKNCGYKLVIQDLVESRDGLKKVETFVESSSPINAPPELNLMQGERILERHMNYFVSNKRLIHHSSSLFSTKTHDWAFRHMKGLKEEKSKPFLWIGLIIGAVGLLLGRFNAILFFIGAAFIILGFWYKKVNLIIHHIDGEIIEIPKIDKQSGQKLASVLRKQFYDKEHVYSVHRD